MATPAMNSPAAAYLQPDVIRAGLTRRKALDRVFVIVGLIFIGVIALGQLSKWAAHRRHARRTQTY